MESYQHDRVGSLLLVLVLVLVLVVVVVWVLVLPVGGKAWNGGESGSIFNATIGN